MLNQKPNQKNDHPVAVRGATAIATQPAPSDQQEQAKVHTGEFYHPVDFTTGANNIRSLQTRHAASHS